SVGRGDSVTYLAGSSSDVKKCAWFIGRRQPNGKAAPKLEKNSCTAMDICIKLGRIALSLLFKKLRYEVAFTIDISRFLVIHERQFGSLFHFSSGPENLSNAIRVSN